MEYATNVLQLKKSKDSSDIFSLLITKMSCSLISEQQEIYLRNGSLVSQIYGKDSIVENYNCSYSLNETYRAVFEESDLQLVGTNIEGDVRIVELPQCHFFVATLFQPQLNQEHSFPHPLVISFLNSSTGSIEREKDE